MNAKKRLSKALKEVGLTEMAIKAENGYYNDYESPLACPIMELVKDLSILGESNLVIRVKAGEFDGH